MDNGGVTSVSNNGGGYLSYIKYLINLETPISVLGIYFMKCTVCAFKEFQVYIERLSGITNLQNHWTKHYAGCHRR